MLKKCKRLAALLLAALCLLAGCGSQTDGESTPVDDVPVSTAYFGLGYYNNGPLCPTTDDTTINRLLCEALYEGLFENSLNFTASPVLCSEYTGDGTNFTFTLKTGVTFWSGEPLTAQDVIASYQTVIDNEDSPYHGRLTEVASMNAIGTDRVRITLSSPNVNLPRLLDIPIFRAGTQDEDFADGTGPYRPERDGSQWKLVANTSWHQGFLGTIRTITLVSMVRADAAASSFRTGDISLIREPRISSAPTTAAGSVDAVATPAADLHYLGVNHARGALANAKVRQALSAALSRQSLCDTQLQSFADPAVLPVNPQPTDSTLSLNLSADTETAMRLLTEGLAESGSEPSADTDPDEGNDTDEYTDEDYEDTGEDEYYEDTGADDDAGADTPAADTRDADNAPDAQLYLSLLVNSDNSFKLAAAEQIAASWAAIGVSCTVDAQPYETFLSRVQSGDFDVYYGETLLTPDFDLRPLLSAGGALNYGGYSSESMTEAVAAARQGRDTGTLYRRLLEEMPLIPIAFERSQLLLRRGLIDSLSPAPYNAFAGVQAWRMP